MKARSLRWTAGLGLAGIAHVSLFWAVVFFKAPERQSSSNPDHHTTFEYVKAGSGLDSPLMAEQVELFDPRPLLLPTKWNAGSGDPFGDLIDEERRIFGDFDPQFRSGAGNFGDAYGNEWKETESVLTAQAEFQVGVLSNFSRKAEERLPAGLDGFEARVVDLKTGNELYRDRIYNNEARRSLSESLPEWRPAQFVMSVADSFVLQEMTVASSSGSSEADALLRTVVLSGILGRGVLNDGSYLVKIGL